LMGIAVLSFEAATALKPSINMSIVLLIAAGLVSLVLQHWITSLRLKVQFRQLQRRTEKLRRFLIDVARLGMILVAVFGFLAVGFQVPKHIIEAVGSVAFPLTATILVVTSYVFVGIILAYCTGWVLLIIVRCL